MQRHTRTPVVYRSNENRRVRSGFLRQASGAHLILKIFQRPSHTLLGNVQTKAWIQNATPLHSYRWKLLGYNIMIKGACRRIADRFCSSGVPESIHDHSWVEHPRATAVFSSPVQGFGEGRNSYREKNGTTLAKIVEKSHEC